MEIKCIENYYSATNKPQMHTTLEW
jgi:hypothetical protein